MRTCFFVISIVLGLKSFSQTDTANEKQKNYSGISANYQYGNIIPTNEFVEGDNLNLVFLINKDLIAFGFPVTWMDRHHYPNLGGS